MEVATKIIKFNNQTNGRDKIYRTCQYGCKLVWWCLEQNQQDKDTIKKIKLLESAMSTTRKLLRLGKSVDFVKAALNTIHLPDVFMRVTITLSKLNQALYLFFDHIIWAHRVGIVSIDNKYYSQLSSRFWLATLILNLARDLYEMATLLDNTAKQNRLREKERELEPMSNGTREYHAGNAAVNTPKITYSDVVECLRENTTVTLDTVKNSADLFLPLSSLGYIDISPGLVGLCGLISSLVGVATVWNSKLKLSP